MKHYSILQYTISQQARANLLSVSLQVHDEYFQGHDVDDNPMAQARGNGVIKYRVYLKKDESSRGGGAQATSDSRSTHFVHAPEPRSTPSSLAARFNSKTIDVSKCGMNGVADSFDAETESEKRTAMGSDLLGCPHGVCHHSGPAFNAFI